MEQEKKKKKIERILNRQYTGEGYINGSPIVWKKVVLHHFNQILRNQMTVDELIMKMKNVGITFNQTEKLIRYPVIDCLEYISKLSRVEIELGVEEK